MLTACIEQWTNWIVRDLGRDINALKRTWRITAGSEHGVTAIHWDLCTRRNVYHFRLHWNDTRDGPPYFGLTVMSRCWRAGEDWHRGNDLADGHFSEALWQRMLADIVGYEIDLPVPPHTEQPTPTVDPRLVDS